MPARNRGLPRDLSWPLTPGDLRAALGEGEPDAVDLTFDGRCWDDGTLLHAEWVPPISSNHGGGIHPVLWSSVRVSVAPLPAARRALARRVLRQHALPDLAAWIGALRSAPEARTLSRRSRSWRLVGDAVAHRDDGRAYG
ncbi:hypothetical protein [Kitasatospora sp. NPDC088134]|uniref:hypothetical protein n=1 Tax=Kitasatospora sp. NPDC088134 TaxID=3364071 RepID=UPI00381964C0